MIEGSIQGDLEFVIMEALGRLFLLLVCIFPSSNAFIFPIGNTAPISPPSGAILQWNLPRSGQQGKILMADVDMKDAAIFPSTPQRIYNLWQWNGYKINYRVEGPETGMPVLLIHGFGASVGHYRKNIPVLAEQGHRVYAIDLLGFGGSDKPKEVEEFSMELWQEVVVDFIKEFSKNPEEQWVVCGNSIGGLLSIMVTSTLQEKIKGTVLFNSAGGMTSFRDSEVPFFIVPILWFFRNVVFSDTYGPGVFQSFKTEDNVRNILNQVYGNKSAVDDELVSMLLAPSDDDGACEVFLKVFRGPAGPTPEELLPTIKTPVLALWGEDDPWTPLRTGMHPGINFGNYCKTLELITLPETGHCPHDDRPDEVHKHLVPFLKSLA
mmetsp:Transcript_37381/g.48087  ORF Transcript_37381/g.48087 Transcript_37381/m.48087 type:complete len:379 (+) Transcript_37381:61-1197(+)